MLYNEEKVGGKWNNTAILYLLQLMALVNSGN